MESPDGMVYVLGGLSEEALEHVEDHVDEDGRITMGIKTEQPGNCSP